MSFAKQLDFLSRLVARIRADVLPAWAECLDRCDFVGGPRVAAVVFATTTIHRTSVSHHNYKCTCHSLSSRYVEGLT